MPVIYISTDILLLYVAGLKVSCSLQTRHFIQHCYHVAVLVMKIDVRHSGRRDCGVHMLRVLSSSITSLLILAFLDWRCQLASD